MALGCLESTMNRCGIKMNTVWIDNDWTEWSPKAEAKETVYLEFNTNPLALDGD